MSTETLMADAADNARYLYATALQTERTPDAGPVTMTVAQARDLAELLAALAAENAALREALEQIERNLTATNGIRRTARAALASQPGKGDAPA